MKVADVMSRNPLSVTPNTTIVEVGRVMLQHRISGLPITDENGKIIGVVTEGDLLRRAETGTERHRARWLELLLGPGRMAADYVDAHARKVGEVMTNDVVVVAPSDDLAAVVRQMEKHRIKRLPVVENDRLVGIVSRADLVRALVDELTQAASARVAPTSDEDIKSAITTVIDKEPWGPRSTIEVVIKDGVVHLHGTVIDERERRAVVVAAENAPGVKAVEDHLIWVEPNTGVVFGG